MAIIKEMFVSISKLANFTNLRKLVDKYKLIYIVKNNEPIYVMIDFTEFNNGYIKKDAQ